MQEPEMTQRSDSSSPEPTTSHPPFDENRQNCLDCFTLLEGWSSEFPPPPVYTPREENFPERIHEPPVINSGTLRRRSSSGRATRPQHCKAGNVCVGVGDCCDIDSIRAWKTQYVDVREGMMYIAQSKEQRDSQITVSLRKRYISMPRKRIVAVQGGPNSILIKSSSEIQAHYWMMTLSQYCYVAPMMEGYCEKLNRGRVFQERFLRLCSDGVLSWYTSEAEDAEPRGSIQMRGVPCLLDNADPHLIHVHSEPRGYQFRFYSTRETHLWLNSFQWHFGRKLLRRASVPLRNKAK